MNSNINLPKEYEPFKTLDICSNIATDYKIPIGAPNYAPVLVGQGDVPLVWLAVNNPGNSEQWKYLVSMNRSLHPSIKVKVDKSKSNILITAGEDTLLSVTAENAERAKINRIDLRPIGFNIVGDSTGLSVGGANIVNGQFSHVGTVIALG